MGRIQLFHATLDGARELEEGPFRDEKELQKLLERHLRDLLGIDYLDSQHFTGRQHRRFTDTLGLDGQQRPVVIEFKHGQGGGAISQGLDYLYWLEDHKGDFRDWCEKIWAQNGRAISTLRTRGYFALLESSNGKMSSMQRPILVKLNCFVSGVLASRPFSWIGYLVGKMCQNLCLRPSHPLNRSNFPKNQISASFRTGERSSQIQDYTNCLWIYANSCTQLEMMFW